MKKQILFMMFLSLAFVFAGVNKSYGQCVETKFNPVPGKAYTYEVVVDPSGTGGAFNWYVVEAPETGSVELVGATSSTDATIPNNTANPVTVTWDAASVGNTYLLVVEYTYTDGDGCATNNIKAWEIKPLNTFQIAVATVNASGTEDNSDVCRDDVESAIYSSGAIAYDYGTNSFYLKITAANYATNWTPTVAPSGETAPQSFTVAGYFESTDFTGTAIPMATATSVDVIYVKIDLAHGAYEGPARQDLTFAVSAVDGGGNDDVELDGDCNIVTPDPDPDTVTQGLTARPEVTTSETPGFVTP